MREKCIIVCNWKEYGSASQLVEFNNEISRALNKNFTIILCPPMPLLSLCIPNHPFIAVGSQFIDYSPGTGKILGQCLKSVGCQYVLCGHAEYYDKNLQAQVVSCIENLLTPIIFLDKFYRFDFHIPKECILVYEPHDRIGTENAADVNDISECVQKIRDIYKKAIILYGGSVNSSNAAEIVKHTNGLCIGRASRNPYDLLKIIEKLSS